MKTAGSIFLLILLVSTQTPVGQFLKLPVLIQHYVKHQKQQSISFFDFLADHYSTDHRDADLPEDEQLPFKNIDLLTVSFTIVPWTVTTVLILSLRTDRKIIYEETWLPQQYLQQVFHPPGSEA